MKETKQTTPMTFAELVDETVEHYTNNPRSTTGLHGVCMYAGPSGKRCAAARLCDESVTDLEAMDSHRWPSWDKTHHLATLKPKYAHFTTEQIQALQRLHDCKWNWIDPLGENGTKGLSDLGEEKVYQIKTELCTEN